MATVSSELCDANHKEADRRLGKLEESLDANLVRIYNKFDEVSQAMMKRLPIWVTVIISLLASLASALTVAIIQKGL